MRFCGSRVKVRKLSKTMKLKKQNGSPVELPIRKKNVVNCVALTWCYSFLVNIWNVVESRSLWHEDEVAVTALHHGSDPELEAVYPPISVGSGSSVHGHEVLYRYKLLRAVHTPQQISVLLRYDRKKLQKKFPLGLIIKRPGFHA